MSTTIYSLNELSLSDKERFDKYAWRGERVLSNYAFAPIYVWRELFKFYWTVMDERFCLFAEHDGNCFMPIPPLGEPPTPKVIFDCYELMIQFNCSPAVARIENVGQDRKFFFTSLGFTAVLKDVEYIYETQALIQLRGNRFKSKRAAYNHFVQHYSLGYQVYQASHFHNCMELFMKWQDMRKTKYDGDDFFQAMLEDSFSAHRRGVMDSEQLGLIGRVILLDSDVKGYTFGYPLTDEIFCILFEITDLTIKGLSQYLFREFCREMGNHRYINALDDSGLENLKRAKLSYHPSFLKPAYTIMGRNVNL